MKQIKGLDTLRAFAVFFVLVEHMGTWFDDSSASGRAIRFAFIPGGGFGVHLFFVLSGFLITSILLKAKDTDANRFVIIKNFFMRRALRIFPIYYLLLFALLLVNYPDIRQYFWYFATYTSNILSYNTNSWNHFSHTWTLAVEEQFYLLWPWLIIFVNDKYIKYVLFGALFTGILSTYVGLVIQGHMGPLLVYHTFDAFAIGALYAWARLNNARCRKFETAIKILAIPAAILYFYWKISDYYSTPSVGQYLTKTINSMLALWLIILVVNNRSVWIGKYFLGNRVLNFIGKISYGIYLYHGPYLGPARTWIDKTLFEVTAPYPTLNGMVHDRGVDYLIHVFLIISISAISYKLIEKPLLNLKKRFKYVEKKNAGLTSASQIM